MFCDSERLLLNDALTSSPYCMTSASFLALTVRAATMVCVGPCTVSASFTCLCAVVGVVSIGVRSLDRFVTNTY